jgi:hypothetical protein
LAGKIIMFGMEKGRIIDEFLILRIYYIAAVKDRTLINKYKPR